jgi:hypothetical protein
MAINAPLHGGGLLNKHPARQYKRFIGIDESDR